MIVIASKTMPIPLNNAFVELEFSITESIWRGDRKRMRPDILKAEIATRINSDVDCEQFYQYLTAPEQKSLVNCTKLRRSISTVFENERFKIF